MCQLVQTRFTSHNVGDPNAGVHLSESCTASYLLQLMEDLEMIINLEGDAAANQDDFDPKWRLSELIELRQIGSGISQFSDSCNG